MKKLRQFVADYTGKVVDVEPGWGYPGECVSLVQRFLIECVGLKAKARGNGIDIGNTLIGEGVAYDVTGKPRQAGDILIWGGFPDEKGNNMGHTGIVVGEQVFDQTTGLRKTAQLRALLPNVIQVVRLKDRSFLDDSGFKPFKKTLPAGTTLYTRDGVAESIKTSNPHDVEVVEVVNGLGKFHASWLVGTNVSYFKLENDKPNPTPQPQHKDHKGRTVIIPAGATLRDSKGGAEAIKTSRDHSVKVIGQVGNGINPSTLLQFKAAWLIGVSSSYIKLSDIK